MRVCDGRILTLLAGLGSLFRHVRVSKMGEPVHQQHVPMQSRDHAIDHNPISLGFNTTLVVIATISCGRSSRLVLRACRAESHASSPRRGCRRALYARASLGGYGR